MLTNAITAVSSTTRSQAKTEGQGLLEGININKSLSVLGQCIASLCKEAMRADAEEAKKTPEQRAAERGETCLTSGRVMWRLRSNYCMRWLVGRLDSRSVGWLAGWLVHNHTHRTMFPCRAITT